MMAAKGGKVTIGCDPCKRSFTRLRGGTLIDVVTSPEARADSGPADGSRTRRARLAFAVLGTGAVAALAGLGVVVFLFARLSWPHAEPLGNPEFGINYSCAHAEYLWLEDPALGPAGYVDKDRPDRPAWCAEALGRLTQGLGATHVRISVEWSQVEPQDGVYDFRLVDALLARAGRDGTKVLLTVGVKGQRHPEFYIPDWVLARSNLRSGAVISDDPYLREQALRMIAAVVEHVAGSSAIDSWEADNEPYLPSWRAEQWRLGRDFVREEVRVIHEHDPRGRRVIVNHGQVFVTDRRWKDALADGDGLGVSLYPFRDYEILGRTFVVPISELGPITPNYAAQARAARASGRPFYITEMQAEPFLNADLRLVGPANPAPNLTPSYFRRNVDYARRSGASRVYLWGAEWWLFEREHYGDSTWWDLGRAAVTTGTSGR